jgi:DNA-binding LacI/PurR family transcriptional regulator
MGQKETEDPGISKSPTIDTVAEKCGLSRTTVSAVLRGEAQRYRISAKTESLVRSVADQLGWTANFFARSLNKKRTGTIGVLFPDIFEHFMGEIIRGIEGVLQSENIRLLLSTSRFQTEEELRAIEAFRYRGIDGLIIAPYAPFSNTSYRPEDLVGAIGTLPTVVIDRSPGDLDVQAQGYGLVIQKDREAAYGATKLLANRVRSRPDIPWYREVVFVGFDLAASSLKNRLEGYRDAMEELGLQPMEVLLQERNPASSDLIQALETIQSHHRLPKAYLVSTEGLGYKVASILYGQGFRIGKDLYIARFGVDPPYVSSGLIGIEQPHRSMGAEATRLLLDLLRGLGPKKIELDLHVRLPWDYHQKQSLSGPLWPTEFIPEGAYYEEK